MRRRSTANSPFPQAVQGEPELRWWKGNLHTHSLWSDGDEFPEMIADWYAQRGYHFLALTDHNVLSEGMKWMPVTEAVGRSDSGILDRYRQRFGNAWVETRGEPGSTDHEVRLKPLDEFRYLLERRDEFILIPAEEISDSARGEARAHQRDKSRGCDRTGRRRLGTRSHAKQPAGDIGT